jgi:hypothetical protein
MATRSAVRLFAALAVVLFGLPAPAAAQFQPQPVSEPAVGERYVIEASAGFWSPTADMAISSESLGIVGTRIDFKNDLGLTDRRFPELHLVLRPARKHKFRFQYIPIEYTQSSIPERNIVFNGQLYRVGIPVNSTLNWRAYRFGYEYDFVVLSRGFGGFVLDFKYTDVQATLATPLSEEFTHARAPIPAIGGIFRVYVVPTVSITGEITGFKLPENVIEDTTGRYIDVDFYGTINFNPYVGAQIGYRSFDLGYTTPDDVGDFKLKGLYFGGVLRY